MSEQDTGNDQRYPYPDVFLTDDGYLLVKVKGKWTDGDLSFEDREGGPWDEAFQEPMEGRRVDPAEYADRCDRIVALIEELD